MIEYNKWPVVYEDEEINVRRNPEGEDEFGVCANKLENFLLYLPRGTLADIALSNRQKGKQKIDTLSPSYLTAIQSAGLNSDSIIAAITKAYIKEERAYQNFLKEIKQ